MNMFVAKFRDVVKGVITGFDRIVFKGSMLPLMHSEGAMGFFRRHGVRNKDFKTWAMGQTAEVVGAAEGYARERCGDGIIPIVSSKERKEELAHARQRRLGIASGLIGVYSATESCWSYKAQYSAQAGHPVLRRDWMKCKHLYFYYDHEQYGFMNIRLQTWFPYHVQICLNGREWLRRSLERQNVGFAARGNKFFGIDDYGVAQQFLDRQLDTRWEPLLDGFADSIFPARTGIVGPRLSYYWTLWQSEWATDYIFPSPRNIAPLMDSLLRHAFMTGTSTRVLRYMDRPLRKDGTPRADNGDDVLSRLAEFGDGLCVRHWADQNSVKCYNVLNNLRVETTMNNPAMFCAFRHVQGQSPDAPKRLLPLRKGVADVALRAKISGQVNDRFADNLAAAQCETPVREILDQVVKPQKKDGRRVRGLDPTGKDRALLEALAAPAQSSFGLCNKSLRKKLKGKPGYEMTDKQLSAKISRQLRLLCDHHLIRKLGRQNKYSLTRKGRQLALALTALLAASTKQLMEKAA